MKRVIAFVLLCGGCLFGHAAAQGSDPAALETIPFETIFHGWYAGGIVERTALVINNRDDFLSVWNMIIQDTFPPPATPSIDFETTTIIFVSSGVMPSGGYDVTIESIAIVDDGLEVHVLIREPPKDSDVTMALTQPYHGVAMSKTDLPVRFRWETR